MRERLSDYQEKYGDLYNLEATPAESTSYRLAKHDKKRYPQIITANDASGVYYYTNSSHLPVGFSSDIYDALDIQDQLQTLYTSGTVFHAFLGEKLPDWKSAANLVRKIAENYSLPYYTMSPTYSICQAHGYLAGQVEECPVCGKKTETYSRITGYYRPVQNWNDGKTQEFKDRKLYDIKTSVLKHNGPLSFHNSASSVCDDASCTVDDSKAMLFTTKTCPNCKAAKAYLDEAGIEYTVIDAEEEMDLALKFDIMQAPTLVVSNNGEYEKFANLSNIRRFIIDSREVKA